MAKKKPKEEEKKKVVTPKSPKVEKIGVVDISQPTTAELSLRISALETRFSALVEAISKSKSVKGI
jgi:hypothetical protein